MSAYIVGDETIDRIVSYFSSLACGSNGRDFNMPYNLVMKSECQRLANDMMRLNCRSIQVRYPGYDDSYEPILPQHHKFIPGTMDNPVQVLKSLSCWLYQCAEGDIPETSMLYQGMRKIEQKLCYYIVKNSPEYQAAIWG